MDNAAGVKNWRFRWYPVVSRNVMTGSLTANHAAIAAGARFSFNMTVTGAVIGDYVTGVSANNLLVGLEFSHAEVTAADTVTVTLFNPTGALIDPVNAIYRVEVRSAV